MKRKLITAFLVAALTLAAAGCAKPAEAEGPKDTPVRIGTMGSMQMSLDLYWETWEEILEEFDIVADVTITGWLGELNTLYSPMTLFSATVNNVFKGNLPEEIRISQRGSSEVTYSMSPLFKKGNRMLVLLNEINDLENVANYHIESYMKQCEAEGLQYNEEHVIYINNLFSVIYYSFAKTHDLFHFDIEEFNDEMYLINRGGAVLEYLYNGDSEMVPLNEENYDLTNNVISQLYQNDPILEGNTWREKYVFEYGEFTDEIVEFERIRQNNNDQGDDDDQGEDVNI